MCLTTKQIEPRVATEDITCYKVLNLWDNGEYRTPYFTTVIPPEIIEGKKALKPEIKEGETFFDKKLHVEGNCIHSYATEQEGLNQLSHFREVFECVIPKGALYYEGDSNDYASSEIRFVKKIAERKETERVLSLEDIGHLDWDLDKDLIIKIFNEYGFLYSRCSSKYDEECKCDSSSPNYVTTVYEEECKIASGIEEDPEPVEACEEEAYEGDPEPCEEEAYDGEPFVPEEGGFEVTEEWKAKMEELDKKNEALAYRLYLAIKYLEENELDRGEVIMPIVRRIFDQEPEVIIDIKQALYLYHFYFDMIKPLQKVCRIDTEATACAIAAQKLIGKETTIVDYIKGVIETCNAVLSKITE